MRIIILAKRNNAIFLSALLVLGTITTILPSIQAQQYNEDRNNLDRDYKSKENSVNVNNIKCNNINFNLNGIEASLGLPTNDAIAQAQAEDNYEGIATTDTNGWENDERNNNDFRFGCTSNNENENNVVVVNERTPIPSPEPEPEPEPEPTNGIQLTINSVNCGENTVNVQTTVSNVERETEQLVFLIAWTAADGNLIFNNDITVPADAPNPSTTFIGLSQNVEPGEYFIHVIVGGDVASESFTVPSCQ